MASEYLKKKYADVKPDEPVELTKKQKRANWWYYHKVPLLIAMVGIILAGSFVYDIFSRKEPDYQIAYVGEMYLTEEEVSEASDLISSLGEDANEDGRCMASFVSYVANETNPTSYVVPVQLTADLAAGISQIFLLTDPVSFQKSYGVLADDTGAASDEFVSYLWRDCPALQDCDLGMDLYLARRVSDGSDSQAADALWQRMTEGAVPVEWTE